MQRSWTRSRRRPFVSTWRSSAVLLSTIITKLYSYEILNSRFALEHRYIEKIKGEESEDFDSLLPFEKNLEVWRQLWRVFEQWSDLAVIVADVRGLVFEFSSLVFEFSSLVFEFSLLYLGYAIDRHDT